MNSRGWRLVWLLIAMALAATAQTAGAARVSGSSDVVVPAGQPVQIAFTADTVADPGIAAFSIAFRNAIGMAVALHPRIHGFRIRINTTETSCSGDNTASASSIVANTQNVAVLGDLCSPGFGSALPIYDAAGIVTISGSASADTLPGTPGFSVFNRTIVTDGSGFPAWYAAIKALPSDQEWTYIYEVLFGSPPTDFADLYFDAANLLLTRLQQVSHVVGGQLVINRAALAYAVRHTRGFPGVTCTITLDPATGNRVNDPAALARCAAAGVLRH
jgi:ABC-type branched-subunit amino acid transport system substrate-binding protein